MERLLWQVGNFAVGEHSEPARVGEGSERFAREVAGLSVDANGHLRPRVAFRGVGSEGASVTGVAAGQNFLLVLRSDASLSIRFADAPDDERPIEFDSPSNLTGSLSLIDEYDDFVIVKAQGGFAFWLDMREDAPTYLHANRLGIQPPHQFPNTQYKVAGGSNPPVIVENLIYFYRWTYVRAYGDSRFAIRDGNFNHEGVLFGEMESNPSEPMGFYNTLGSVPLAVELVDNDGNPVTRVYPIATQYQIIEFNDWAHSSDPQVTGIMVYQSEGVHPRQRGRVNVDALVYHRIDYVPRDQPSSETGQTATQEVWADQPSLSFDHDVLPETERIHVYNDRIFAPTDEGLRFSAVDGTVLKQWAFPKVNAIHRSGVVDLLEHRGVLLFGGPTDLHSLTGTSPYDFVVNRLGSLGPVSSHAMAVLKDSVSFVGSAGFYATDGTGVQKISDALDADFEGYEVVAGHCHQLPDDSIVFVAQQHHEALAPRKVAYHYDRAWFAWPSTAIRQMARWRVAGTLVMMADEKPVLRELVWKVSPAVADDHEADDFNLIDWHWQSERLNFGDERLKHFRELQIEGEALSLVAGVDARWPLTIGEQTAETGLGWRLSGEIFGVGDFTWGTAEVPAPVRLSVWIDEKPVHYEVFEMRREDYRPQRIPLNRKGKSIQFKLEGRGHLHLRALTLQVAR